MQTFGCRIEKLESHHLVADFDCGQQALNDYLKNYALVNQKRHLTQTYLGISDETVVGFYSIAVGSVGHTSAPKKVSRGLPRYDIPIFLLARLAIDLDMQNKGFCAGLLKDAMYRAMRVSHIVGIRAFVVHAKDEKAAAWYQKFNFEPSPLNAKHLFLTMKDIENNFAKEISKKAG